MAKTPNYHTDASNETMATVSNDGGGWIYDPFTGDINQGNVWVNCTDTDTKASMWTTY
jgi:hypothetical protein